MSMQVNTNHYQFSHGKAPRGTGSWAFFPNVRQQIEDAFWVHQATFADAKRAAVAHAKAAGWAVVVVGS